MSQRIPEQVIENVRNNVNIVDIVGQYVQLSKSGRNLFGLCPFHEEKTPSFSVSEEKQIFHCFSCHRGGNVFKFIMEIENVSFPEAVLKVAELGNIEIDKEILHDFDSSDGESSNSRKLKKVHADAAQLYHHILINTQIGEEALSYLHERGLNDDLINEFNLGYAPEKAILAAFFKERKVAGELLRKSGLFVEYGDGTMNDRFRNRVLFPIRDAQGSTIAFSGRLLHKDDKQPKYLNSPETELFNKRKVLFNFDKAKSEIRQKKFAILFEGFMDVLAAYRSGVKNGIASMGTSLTNEQIYLLERTTNELFLCYDGDEAGQNAIARALELLEPVTKLKLGVIRIPEKLDPDEYVQKYGEPAFEQLISDAHETKIAFYMRHYQQNRNLANESDQLAYIADVMQKLAVIESPVEQDLYLNQLASRFSLEKDSLKLQLREYIGKFKPQKQFRAAKESNLRALSSRSTANSQKYSRVERAERLLLYRILHEQNTRIRLRNYADFSFVHDDYQLVYTISEGYFNAYPEYETARFLDFLDNERARQLVVSLELDNYALESSDEEFEDCINVISKESPLEQSIAEIKHKIADAKKVNNNELVTSLTIKLVSLLQQQQTNKSASL
ncbi:DNA primase [Liquorilactobacillus mali]|uniref:DNA primase n=1 Tax=Liquorilactobacillus mali TaxID=1618 RepID=A0A0R2FPB7_9LACO|nr:DNA primase [Liquorilactobacillus mali]KRN30393.1 DNA primase [Liquorilactobacillus mali]MDN7144661.1 DNA primase [Liquorilactobacillus mali]